MVALKPLASSFGEPERELASLALGEIMTSRRGLPADVEVLRKAIAVAAQAHQGQTRTSGEPYITHPLKVAELVASLGVDEHSVVAAILHDAVEDSELSLDDLEADFGQDVRLIVDGLTKLDRLAFDSKEAQQAATIRKMMIAMAS
ncbi:MAG: HD domain-containing protein, partial [Actinobacteria bacterium]|nr:HD domain-containing protein [Actinomycetota bacterium]